MRGERLYGLLGSDGAEHSPIPNPVIPAKAGIAGLLVRPCRKGGWVYILTNNPDGVLYIGVTSHIAARMMQHREGKGSAFCRKYGLKTLVYAEQHDEIVAAIAREKALKAWKREWKIRLIESLNPTWEDLFERLV